MTTDEIAAKLRKLADYYSGKGEHPEWGAGRSPDIVMALTEAASVLSDGATQIDELKGALIEQTVRADEALEELGALAYHPVFDDGQDHDDGEPRVTGWECRICGALEPKLSTFDHLDECPLHKPLPEAPK